MPQEFLRGREFVVSKSGEIKRLFPSAQLLCRCLYCLVFFHNSHSDWRPLLAFVTRHLNLLFYTLWMSRRIVTRSEIRAVKK